MKTIKTLLLIVLMILTAFPVAKAELQWYNTKAEAIEKAKKEGKMVLLFNGRTTCFNCKTTKANMEKAAVKEILDSSFILWWCDCDVPKYNSEAYPYMNGLGQYFLPLICVIDPNKPDEYKVRSTNILYEDGLIKLLSPYKKTAPAVETMTISKSENEPLYTWLSQNATVWKSYGITIKADNEKVTIENSDKLAEVTNLNISNSRQTNIDPLLAKMPNLKSLNCKGNNLSSINISKSTELEELYCSSNKLSALDISKNAKLTNPNKFELYPQTNATVNVTATAKQKTDLASKLSTEKPKYDISIDGAIKNGTVKVSQTKAEKGTKITLSITPKDGYELKEGSISIYQTDNKYKTFDLNAKDLTFTMPECPITITASFEKSKVEIPINSDVFESEKNITVSPNEVKEGTEVTLSINKKPNNEPQEGTITIYQEGKVYKTFDVSKDNLTFIMPRGPITIAFAAPVANDIVMEDIAAWANNGSIYVKTDKAENVSIYDFNGRMILSKKVDGGTNAICRLPKGLYILKMKQKTFKLFVK